MEKNSFLEGSIVKGLLFFAIPLFFSNLFQQLYNTIDTVLIGYYLGDNSLAAVGSTAAIFELIVGFTMGMGTGFGIISARYFGSKDHRQLKKSIALSIILGLLISILLTVISYFSLPVLLNLLHTPSEIYQEALSYIQFIALFLSVTMFYNLSAGMLRAIGDSLTPLIVLFVASIINVFLDILCITTFDMGVTGAAVATVFSQFIATIICFFAIYKKAKILIPSREHFVYDKEMIADLLTQGSSMGLMLSIVSIGTVILQSAINGLGTAIITAHTAARKIISLLLLPINTLATSISTFVSQNKGAQQFKRIRQGVRIANIMSWIYSIVITVIIVFSAHYLVEILSNSSNSIVLDNGALYLWTNVPFLVVLGPLCILRNGLQGLGKKLVPLVSSIIELLGKVVFTALLIPAFKYLGVCFCEPIIWILMTIQLCYAFYHADEIKLAK